MSEAPVYYARDDRVFKSPVATPVPSGRNVTVGFPVCTASDYVEAKDIAEMLIAAERFDVLLKALESVRSSLICEFGSEVYAEDYAYIDAALALTSAERGAPKSWLEAKAEVDSGWPERATVGGEK